MLRHIYEQVEHGALQEALAACDRVIQQQPTYMYDALRFQGRVVASAGTDGRSRGGIPAGTGRARRPLGQNGPGHGPARPRALDEAEQLAEQVTQEAPDYLSAYDFLASVHEAQGGWTMPSMPCSGLPMHRRTIPCASAWSGDVAMRNKDMLTAEKAYGKVIERSKGSSLRTVDDFANLSRVLVERGHIDASRKIAADMKREWRGDKQAELAALVTESLCLHAEGAEEKARGLVDQALACSNRPGGSGSQGPATVAAAGCRSRACLLRGRQGGCRERDHAPDGRREP